MSISRTIFRPGAGQVPKKFVTAFVNGTTVYRGDLVVWDILAPTSQGASGVLDGKTLGTSDFIFVKLHNGTIVDGMGVVAGIVEGKTTGQTDTVNPMTNDKPAIIQTWGVHDTVQTVGTTSAISSILDAGTNTAGACDVTVTGDVNTLYLGTDAIIPYCSIVGVAMKAHSTYTRAAATVNRCTAFLRCNA